MLDRLADERSAAPADAAALAETLDE